MAAPNISHVICVGPAGRQVVADTTDAELAAAMVRAELARRAAGGGS